MGSPGEKCRDMEAETAVAGRLVYCVALAAMTPV